MDESDRWTWCLPRNARILNVFESPANDWPGELERAAGNSETGKVVCVVAGVALARAVVQKQFAEHEQTPEAIALLNLADAWIDDPTGDRFDEIAKFLFDDGDLPVNDPRNVVWWALRIATSSVGNYEAGWALVSVVDEATKANLNTLEIAQRAVEARAST